MRSKLEQVFINMSTYCKDFSPDEALIKCEIYRLRNFEIALLILRSLLIDISKFPQKIADFVRRKPDFKVKMTINDNSIDPPFPEPTDPEKLCMTSAVCKF